MDPISENEPDDKKDPETEGFDGLFFEIDGEEDNTIRPYDGPPLPSVPEGITESDAILLVIDEDDGEPPYTWQSGGPQP